MKTWRINYKYLNSWKNQILMKKYNMFNWIGAVVLFYHFQSIQTMTKQNFDLTQNFQHTFHLFEIHNIGEKQFIFIILKRKMIKRSWILPKFWIPIHYCCFSCRQTDWKWPGIREHGGLWQSRSNNILNHIQKFLFWFYLIFSKTVHTVRFYPRSGTVPRPPNTCLIHTGWQRKY